MLETEFRGATGQLRAKKTVVPTTSLQTRFIFLQTPMRIAFLGNLNFDFSDVNNKPAKHSGIDNKSKDKNKVKFKFDPDQE